ncbi:MAG TPA: acetyl-CoA decarbonylase/synthase complex subunit gamma [Dehalococcoidales bacterium]|nr:MAG: acetyl-CoA decarbonylase/synthase complex subunit gamma [Chloroflexi bacterium RBG_16_60_22]HJX12364.1 acetyl-CoA decarbonylase/synthase complex subunit gamma [Dehalococcoidales bacterium]
MPLTGIEIFKLLPKTNCGDCGVPTCLAFAMNLAAGKAELSKCPHVSEEAKAKLSEASAPPILPVTIGAGDKPLKVGGDTVMFRHEKRFENPPGIAILISDKMADAEVTARLKKARDLSYERVGLTLSSNLVALKAESGDAARFAALATKAKGSDANIILMSDKADMLAAGLKACADKKPLLYTATKDNADAVAALAKENGCPVVAKADGLEALAALTEKLAAAGLKNIVLDAGSRTVRQALQDQIVIRSAALNKKFRPLGYPTIVFPAEMTDNPMKEALIAAMFVAKYAGIIVLSDFQGEVLFPLLVARLNIYTDPQRPLATTQGIYEINNPTENSPLMVTSNFSLTYFIVSGEIENSKVPSYLYVKDTEGLSVMTSWAAGKFSADIIAPAILKSGIGDKIKHRKLIIPGYIAAESGGLEEEMSGWEIMVGPREAAHLTPYLKAWKPN